MATRIGFLVSLVASSGLWDEGYETFAMILPFVGAFIAWLSTRAYFNSERPRIDWRPGDDPPSR